jgi:hypothetical protein
MAILSTNSGSKFSLTPVTPTSSGPRDAYDIAIHFGDKELFTHQYNVNGWQGGHSDLWAIANACRHISSIIDKTTPVDLTNSGEATDKPLEICINVLWLETIISAFTFLGDTQVTFRFYLWISPDQDYAPDEGRSEIFTRFIGDTFFPSVEQTIQFGKSLALECIHAQQMRRILKMEHFDDVIVFQ